MYLILILPLLSGFIAQTSKILIKSNKRKFNFQGLMGYSGMPSSHSAMVISLATIIGLEEGFHSPIFALSAVFAFVVIRDALGIRNYLGQHSLLINVLVKDLKEDDYLDRKYPHLLERVGHTPMQVLVGGIIGMIISLAGWFFF